MIQAGVCYGAVHTTEATFSGGDFGPNFVSDELLSEQVQLYVSLVKSAHTCQSQSAYEASTIGLVSGIVTPLSSAILFATC